MMQARYKFFVSKHSAFRAPTKALMEEALEECEPLLLLEALEFSIARLYRNSGRPGLIDPAFHRIKQNPELWRGVLAALNCLKRRFGSQVVAERLRVCIARQKLETLERKYNLRFARSAVARKPAAPPNPDSAKTTQVKSSRKTHEIPVASREQTRYIEELMRYRCDRQVPRIRSMSLPRLAALKIKRLMSLDLERGICLGQIPHRVYRFSRQFKAWEDLIWDLIQAREDVLGQAAEEWLFAEE
jgi:hypothetical protein